MFSKLDVIWFELLEKFRLVWDIPEAIHTKETILRAKDISKLYKLYSWKAVQCQYVLLKNNSKWSKNLPRETAYSMQAKLLKKS